MLLGLLALLFMALQVSNLGTRGPGGSYELKAYFDNIGGLKLERRCAAPAWWWDVSDKFNSMINSIKRSC